MAGAILHRPGEGEHLSRRVRVKADREELVLTESRYRPGDSGPGPHIHRQHSDCFWVLDGELTFEVGGRPVRGGAGSFVLVPPGVVHTFRNEGPGEASFLNVHAPGCGFAEHLRALRAGDEELMARFDQAEPPEDGGRPASEAIVLGAGGGERVGLGSASATFKAGEAPGSLSLTELQLPPGFPGSVLHRHESFVDSFYVLEGTLALRLGEETVEAEPGTFAAAPPGVEHTFSNPGDHPVRALNLMAPGGFERHLTEVAAAVSDGAPLDPDEMAEIASRHDFHPV